METQCSPVIGGDSVLTCDWWTALLVRRMRRRWWRCWTGTAGRTGRRRWSWHWSTSTLTGADTAGPRNILQCPQLLYISNVVFSNEICSKYVVNGGKKSQICNIHSFIHHKFYMPKICLNKHQLCHVGAKKNKCILFKDNQCQLEFVRDFQSINLPIW